jgi:hypothetical protein
MRTAFVAALTAVLVGVPAVAAHATMDKCPAGVSEVTGTNPTLAEVETYLADAATAQAVPLAVLEAIAYKESAWKQYASDGHVLVSGDAVCGLGIMQVTADETRDDAVRLANDPAYNVMEGAKILKADWAKSQETAPPTGASADDPDVVENWYYAICLYNGCPNNTDDSYAIAVAKILNDPFKTGVPLAYRTYVTPVGFTTPIEADPDYVFPYAFQARHAPDEFVFYDYHTGTVTKTVVAPTHLLSATPVVTYPAATVGPDGPNVSCTQCNGWRLDASIGVAHRARWTNSVTGADQATISWVPSAPVAGRYRLEAYVPAFADPLATVTYHLPGGTTRDVDQNTRKGQWIGLFEDSASGPFPIWLGDHSGTVNVKIAADAMRLLPVPTVSLSTDFATIGYGGKTTLRVDLTDVDGQSLANRSITIYARPVGTTTWKGLGLWKTDSTGGLAVGAAPSRNTEYTARFVPATTDPHARAASNNVRVSVGHRVNAASVQSSTSGQAVSVSVGPNHAGRTVYLQRLYGSTWKTVLSRTLSSSSATTFSFTVTVDRTQVIQFRGYMPTDAEHLGAYSVPVYMTVQR